MMKKCLSFLGFVLVLLLLLQTAAFADNVSGLSFPTMGVSLEVPDYHLKRCIV